MPATTHHDERIANLTLATVYPLYLAKIEKKGRTKAELHQVMEWLLGCDEAKLQAILAEKQTLAELFEGAALHPNAHLITGRICGYRVEEIAHPLTQKVRYLDKLVDELAQGRAMNKILRGS
jgi:hypothetical protein